MFKVLRKIMGVAERKEIVPFSQLDEWFNEKLKQTSLKEDLNNVFDTISASLQVLHHNLRQISAKEIHGVSEDHRSVIEEHTEQYVTKMGSLVNKLLYRETRNFGAIMAYGKKLEAGLDEMKSIKENPIIQKFFRDETLEIEHSIAGLSEAHGLLNELMQQKNGLVFIAETKKRINEVEKKYQRQTEIQIEIQKIRTKKEDAENYRLRLETDLDNIKTSEDYEKFDRMLSRKIKLEKELEREQAELDSLFGVIIPLLRSYDEKSIGADGALARAYANNYVEALSNDKGLWIVSLLQSVTSKLNEIEDDVKKRARQKQALDSLSEEFLRQSSSRIRSLHEYLGDVRRQILNDMVSKRIEDIKYKISHVDSQIDAIDQTMASHEQELQELNIEKDLLNLGKNLSSFGEVTIQ